MLILAIIILLALLLFVASSLLVPIAIGYFTIVGIMYMFSSPKHGSWRYEDDMRLAKEFERGLKEERRKAKRFEKKQKKELRKEKKNKAG